jgi:hypothetical protein
MYSNFLYQIAAMVYCNGTPFKKSIFTNFYFLANISLLWILNICLVMVIGYEFWIEATTEYPLEYAVISKE